MTHTTLSKTMHTFSYPDDFLYTSSNEATTAIFVVILIAYIELMGINVADAKYTTASHMQFLGKYL